jgi:MHS family proline/betaine transporter-like MFS transporter
VVEHAEPHQRGFMGSWAMVGAVAGILLGSAIGAVVATVLSAADLEAWGWRVPFLLGIVVGLVGIWLRRSLPDVMPPRVEHAGSPLLVALRTEGGTILRMMAICLVSGPIFYILFVYVVSYVQMVDGVSPAVALDINTISMVGLIAALLIGGAVSDRIGRRPVALIGAVGFLLLSWPMFRLMHEPSFWPILAGQMILGGLLGFYGGQQSALLVESFPSAVRCSALAFSYNVVVGLFGGFTPIAVTWLIHRTDIDMMPALIMIAIAAIILLAIARMPETAGRPLR